MLMIPLLVVLSVSNRISIDLLGIDAETANNAHHYILIIMPGAFFLTHYTILNFYMQQQKETLVPVFGTAGGFFIHLICLFIFETWLKMGLTGVAIATAIHLFSRFAIVHVCLTFHKRLGPYYRMNLWREARVSLKDQFIFCLKSTPMSCLPWWGADMFTFIASFLSTEVLAAQTIIRNITLLTFMFPVGISLAS